MRKAIIPAAGLGTRLLPATRSVPKALMPILSTPIIDYTVRELVESGITDIALILSYDTLRVAEYFYNTPALLSVLKKNKQEQAIRHQRIVSLAKIITIIQSKPAGLGHAILTAKNWVDNESFAVILPDDLIWARVPAIKQLMEVKKEYGGNVIGAIQTPLDLIHTKGVIIGEEVSNGVLRVKNLVEKPKPCTVNSRTTIVGRYILEPSVFEHIPTESANNEDIQITDAILTDSKQVATWAKNINGVHIDVGNPQGILEATLLEASKNTVMKDTAIKIVNGWQ